MRYIAIFLLSFTSLLAHASQWIVEAEPGGHVTWSKDSVADIHAQGGLTLWNTHMMQGNVIIEYDARIVGDGRVSDLNCFWMASVGEGSGSPITPRLLKARGGRFLNSYTMRLYYLGYGGNYNSTTRFRRYTGDGRGVDSALCRPRILREYLDTAHLITADHWYHIRLEQIDGRVRYIIDGECLVDYVDPHPLTKGWFGFRTTLSHAQLRNFTFSCTNPDNAPVVIRPIGTAPCREQPVTFGVPFSQGELADGAPLQVSTSTGTPVPADQWTLATWPDGSVKWKAVATVVPPASQDLQLSKGKDKTRYNIQSTMRLCISTNGLLADSIMISGTKVIGNLWLELNGKRQPVTSAVHEQQGSVRDCWRFDGDDFCVRMYLYRGSNEIKLVHTSFIDSLTNAGGLRSLCLKAEIPVQGKLHQRKTVFLTSAGDSASLLSMDVKPLIARRPVNLNANGEPADPLSARILPQLASWDGFRLSQLSPGAFSIRKRATEQSPWIGTIEGHRSPGMVAFGDNHSSVALQLTDFWQSYPSTLQVDHARSDNAVVSLYMWSKEAEPMSFCHYDTIPHGLEAAYEDVQPGMSTANGTARTSVIYLYPSLQPVDTLASKLASLANHAQYLPTPEYLHRKRAFGFWSLDKGTATDTTLTDIIRFYADEQERHSWYGYFNYGDVMHSYDASRGEWRYDVGGYAWDNTELGTPAMLWYQFLRTGSPVAWRMAVAMSRHNAEVDCYHRGPHAGLGTRHNVLHWGCGAKEARISQAFFNRFLYYLTADERTGDILHEVVDADTLLYHLDPMRLAQPRSERYPCTAPARLRVGPDWLAYAGNWFTEWERTGNTKYRDKILAGMRSIAHLPHGLFSGPKALGYDPSTGIITWEGDTVVQNTNHLLSIMGGFEMMNEMMLSLTTPEWSRAWLTHAMDYKEKALTISRNHFRIPRLKAYAYWHTGNKTCYATALEDLQRNEPFRMLRGAESMNTIPMGGKGGFYTNDAATYALDAIFMQEVMTDAQPVPVILTAGQSNADGRVPLDQLPSYLTFDKCYWSYGSGDFETATGCFSPYSPRVAKPGIEHSWGFDAVVYHLLSKQQRQPLYIIKHTDGGTAISPTCKGSTHQLYWSADTTFLSHTGSASHGGRSLLKAFIRQIDDCLPRLPQNYDIKCLLWHQGESDQSADTLYYENLKAVVAYVRQHLVTLTGNKRYSHLPVICGTYSQSSRQRSQRIVDALYRLQQEDADFHVVDASDLPLLRDRLHFDAQGAETLGHRVYDVLRTLP